MRHCKPTQTDQAYKMARSVKDQPRADISALLASRFSRTLSEFDCDMIADAIKKETKQ